MASFQFHPLLGVRLTRSATRPRRRPVGSGRAARLSAGIALVAVTTALAWGDSVIRRGNQFVVNTYTYGIQRRPQVASGQDGSFVVVWQSFYTNGADYQFAVFGQRFGSNGGREGGEFLVNSFTLGAQDRPSVAVEPDGGFVVVWDGPGYGDGSAYQISGQRYSSTGAHLGGEFTVSFSPYQYDYSSWVAPGADGSFVVAWTSYPDADGDSAGVLARRFDASGTPQGGEFIVNSYTTGVQAYPAVGRAADGSFVVVWADRQQFQVSGRRFDASGAPQGGEFAVGTAPSGYPDVGVAEAADGSFVVAWDSSGFDGSNVGVVARRYDAAGAPLGAPFVINTYTTGPQHRPVIAAMPGGGFVVSWFSEPQGTTYARVMARRYDSTGAPKGGEFAVSTNADAYTAYRHALGVSGGGDGTFVVVWWGFPEGSYGGEVFAQRFYDGTIGCSPTPLSLCRRQTQPHGIFRFKDVTNDAHDSLVWQWVNGEAVSPGEFDDPTTNTAYALCVYDSSGATQPIASLTSFAGGPCRKGVQCWTHVGGNVSPNLRYFDGDRTSDGIQLVLLRPGIQGKSRVSLRAGGPNLTLPATPLTAPVTVQLQGSNGFCATSTYNGTILLNGDGQFRARPDVP